jgi:hypothetical protein
VLADCTDAGGPSFITLGVDVTPVTATFGTGGTVGTGGTGTYRPADICVRLPVLLGSIVDKSESPSSGVRVNIHATRNGANVTFPSAENDGTARSFELAELRIGVDETVVLSVDGEIFEANITTGCTNP